MPWERARHKNSFQSYNPYFSPSTLHVFSPSVNKIPSFVLSIEDTKDMAGALRELSLVELKGPLLGKKLDTSLPYSFYYNSQKPKAGGEPQACLLQWKKS